MLLVLPFLGCLLYQPRCRQADGLQGRPPNGNDDSSHQAVPEEQLHPEQPDEPEATASNDSSTSSSYAPEREGECERRLRLVRALYFLRGRLEEAGRDLLPWERQTIDEATRLLSGGDCVNDARLFGTPEHYSAPAYLNNTYEAEFTRIYGCSPATVLAQSETEAFVTVTNKLGELTKNGCVDESELESIRSPVATTQSILISSVEVLPSKYNLRQELRASSIPR